MIGSLHIGKLSPVPSGAFCLDRRLRLTPLFGWLPKISMGLTLDALARRLRCAECGGPLQSIKPWRLARTCSGNRKGEEANGGTTPRMQCFFGRGVCLTRRVKRYERVRSPVVTPRRASFS